MSLCSELENMNTSINYYYFIKDVFEDYIKYISNYRNITNEYIKKLCPFQEKYGPRLSGKDKDNSKYKNININHIYSITSPIQKIINKQIENLKMFMFGIESQIDNYNSIIKEKDILSTKFQLMFDEAKKDLLKKYRDIDRLRDNFMASMSNTEDIINKYIKRKDSSISLNEMKNSITASKKIEKEYKKLINSTGCYEETFDSLYVSSIENIKKLTSGMANQMKDIIIDFIILLQNNIKMQASEIDLYLPGLNEINEAKAFEDIIESSFKKNNKLVHVKPDKYKLKIFEKENDNDDVLNTNPILNIEDGFQEMTIIKDINILSAFKTMKENFELVDDHNMNIKIEEEKLKCMQLTDKILELENPNPNQNSNKNDNKNNNTIGPKDEDVEELNNLLDIHHNRVVFLQKLSEYRNKGKFEISQKTFDIFSRLFNTIIKTVERDNDFHSVKNAIILSQTYFIKTDEQNGKKYLQKIIQHNDIFKSKKFWEEFLEFSINKEIVTCVNNDVKNGNILKENRKEAEDKMSNIAFAQILPYADNMIEFGLDKDTIMEVVFPKMIQYKMSNELIESIKSIVNSK